MATYSEPSPASLRLWRNRLTRATNKRKAWLKESQDNVTLGNNDEGAWAANSPVIGDRTGKSSIIVRNIIGQNARQEVNRMMPKEPKWIAKPVVPFVYEEGPNGMAVEQNNSDRAQIVQTAMNFVSNAVDVPAALERAALDGEFTSRGYIKVGYIGGADLSATAPLPYDTREQGNTDTNDLKPQEVKMAKRPGLAHGSVKPYLPYVVRIPFDRVLCDPDAVEDREVNWIAHEIVRPLGSMKDEMVNEVDYEAQTVKRKAKYKNLSDLKPNAKPVDKTDPMGPNSDAYAEDFLKFWEVHYRVPELEPGSTMDGFEYYILSMVDYQEGSPGVDPVCIRHERYALDVGGFYITPYTANLVNDDLYGFVPGIRDAKGPATLFNSLASAATNWIIRNKTVRWYNSTLVEADDIQMLADSEAGDFVPLNIKQNVPADVLMGVVPATPLPPDLVPYQQFLLNLTNEQTGRSENQRGSTANVRTASEAQIVAQETSGQVAAKQKRFRKFSAEVMRKAMVIFTRVLPDQGPMKEGRWALPDPEVPGKFLHFQKRDLFCYADIELDIVSQVLRDDNVVVQQGMQLLDLLSKIMVAPPAIFEKIMPLLERVIAAMGPDWESRARKMFAPDQESQSPENEHIAMLIGEAIQPSQDENLQEHIEKHTAMLKNATRMGMDESGRVVDPETNQKWSEMWNRPLGVDERGNTITPFVLLAMHLQMTEDIARMKGIPLAPGAEGGGEGGSGIGSGRVPQAAPNEGELAAGAATVGTTTPGVRGGQQA